MNKPCKVNLLGRLS